jgi:site-specific recombinase XerD
MKISRAYNTWVSYAQDLNVFFQTIPKVPEAITRADCLEFMKRQTEVGCSGATINRRLD